VTGAEQGDWVGNGASAYWRGARGVYLAARDVERGRTAAEALGARFVELGRHEATRRVRLAANVVEREEGHLDVLVNNAGITGPLRDVHEYTGEDVAAVLLTNVAGYVRVMHAFLPLLELSADPTNRQT